MNTLNKMHKEKLEQLNINLRKEFDALVATRYNAEKSADIDLG